MKTWDAIVIGGGIIGLSLSIELRKKGASVLVVERGEPGREASFAAGGMLVDCSAETHPALQPLATASARIYPEFVRELQVESGLHVDLREQGAIVFPPPEHVPEFAIANLLRAPVTDLEAALADSNRPAFYLKERSVEAWTFRRATQSRPWIFPAAALVALRQPKRHSTRQRSSTAPARGLARSRLMLFPPVQSKDKCFACSRPLAIC